MPTFDYRPMLATPADELPDGDWAFEVKWDGIRAAAVVDQATLRLISRNGRDITVAYPELAELAGVVADGTVLDGEIVATDERGNPSFERLQQRMHVRESAAIARLARELPVAFLAFDVLRAGSEDRIHDAWHARRERLTDLVPAGPNWRVSPVELGPGGAALFERTVELGLEGVIAKRRTGRYEPGRRSPNWRKIKHFTSQEFVVGGYELGGGGRAGRLGSLLLGVYDDAGALVYCGGVGTGFTNVMLDVLTDALRRIERPGSPFAGATPKDARFVEPVIVVDVRFVQWTDNGSVRAPSFRGVRTDIDPAQVQRISR